MAETTAILDPTAITFLGEPFELVPAIRDILRTRYCVPGSIFLVEGIERISVSKSGRWQAVRLLLGDGVLCIQALLSGNMHRFVQTDEVAVGSYIRCETFFVKWQDVGGRALVYLVLEDLVTLGWNESYRVLKKDVAVVNPQFEQARVAEEDAGLPALEQAEKVEGADLMDDLVGEMIETIEESEMVGVSKLAGESGMVEKSEMARDSKTTEESKSAIIQEPDFDDDDDDDDDEDDEDAAFEAFEAFETLTLPVKPQHAQHQRTQKKPDLPIALPRDWHDPQTPLKLTTLRSIPHLPYKQNWSCNILAIVSSLSLIEPSNLPPHRQRTARLVDPSTTKQVHLTVFLDPENFNPRIGSAVLLVGVKNHRFDGGSLKKYESDRKNGRWWFEDPVELAWCDVEGIKTWWAEASEQEGS